MSCKYSSNSTSNCRKIFLKFLKNTLLLQSTPSVTRHEMWLGVSEVTTDCIRRSFKTERVEGENRPAAGNKLYLFSESLEDEWARFLRNVRSSVTRCHIPEERGHHPHCRESIKTAKSFEFCRRFVRNRCMRLWSLVA